MPLASNSATPIPPPIVIKFHALACHGGPVLSIAIGDHPGQYFLADTGSDGTYIATNAAKRCNLKIETAMRDGKPVVDTDGKIFHGYNGTLTIGNLKMPGFIPLDPGELQTLFDILDAQEPDEGSGIYLSGIIGTNILGYYAVEIDPISQMMRLHSGAMTEERLKSLGFSGGAASGAEIKMDESRGGVPFVAVDVSTTKAGAKAQHTLLPMMIDTGSFQTAVASNMSDLFAGVSETSHLLLHQTSGDLLFHAYENVSLRVGGVTLDHFTCGAIDKGAPAVPQNVASLGMDFFAHYHVLIDFIDKRLYLEPIDPKVFPDNPTLHENQTKYVEGLIVEPTMDGGWVVKAAASGSRFTHSGMKVGDRVLEADGTALSGKSPQAVEFLLTRAGSINVQRQEKKLHIGILK